MPEPVTPVVSPTGIAIIKQGLLRVGAGLVGLAATAMTVLPMLPPAPWVTQATAVATAVIGVGAVLGIASQGIRKTGDDAAAKVTTTDDALKQINR